MEGKEQVFVMYLTKEEKDLLKQKDDDFTKLQSDMTALQTKFDDINGKYQEKVHEEENANKQAIIQSYSDTLTEEEVATVVPDITMFSAEDIDIKLAAFLGKKIKKEQDAQKEQKVFSSLETNFSGTSKWAEWLKKM